MWIRLADYFAPSQRPRPPAKLAAPWRCLLGLGCWLSLAVAQGADIDWPQVVQKARERAAVSYQPVPAPLPAPAGPALEPAAAWESSSAIHLYMREMGKVDLLTPAQEIELAARIKQGDMAARERMIRANLRLVVKIAGAPLWSSFGHRNCHGERPLAGTSRGPRPACLPGQS